MKVYMYPNSNNDYINIIKKAMCDLDIKFTTNIKKAQYLHLNWYEDLPNKRLLALLMYIKKITIIYYALIKKKKIIYVFHNKTTHDLKKNIFLQSSIQKLLIKRSKNIIILSKNSKKLLEKYNIDLNKIVFVPHPNYIDYIKDNIKYPYKKDKNELTILFLGQVRPYKNIETIIKVANSFNNNKIKFLICGKALNDEYKNKLLKMIKNNNIITDFRHIKNEELPSLFKKIDLTILPYNTYSTLNSGVLMLSLSFKKPVITSDYAMAKDFKKENGIYLFHYSNNEIDNVNAIKKYINTIYNNYRKNSLFLTKEGNNLYKLVKKDNSIKKITKQLKIIYKK